MKSATIRFRYPLPVIAVASLCLVCLLASLPAGAADEPPTEVATLLKQWLQDKKLQDPKMIGAHLADDFVGVGPRGQAMDKRQFVEVLASPDIDVSELQSSEQSIRLHGQVVVVTGILEITGRARKQDITGRYRYVDVLRKVGDRWQIIASTLTRVQEAPATLPAAK